VNGSLLPLELWTRSDALSMKYLLIGLPHSTWGCDGTDVLLNVLCH